jgi:hypothetical protein
MFVSQDRIGRDGSLISGNLPIRHASVPEPTRRPPSLPLTAPLLPPISDHQLQELVDFVTGNRCCLSDSCCPVSVKRSISSICQSCPCCAFYSACGQSLQSWHALFYGPASRIPGPYSMDKLCWTLVCTLSSLSCVRSPQCSISSHCNPDIILEVILSPLPPFSCIDFTVIFIS